MSWVATAIVGTGLISAKVSKDSAKGAASASNAAAETVSDASTEAARIQAESQTEALNYLKEINALPQHLREQALQELSGFYKIPGDPAQPRGQNELIQEATNSPLYAAIMGTRQAGEQSILRNQSATGGLRSGNTNAALTDFGQQTANRALLDSFNQTQNREDYNIARSDRERGLQLAGISGLAGLQGNDQAIAQMMTSIGNTNANGVMNAGNATAGGILSSAQAKQQGTQGSMNNLLGIAGLGLQAYGLGMF